MNDQDGVAAAAVIRLFPGLQYNADHQTQLSLFAKRVEIIEQLLQSYRR